MRDLRTETPRHSIALGDAMQIAHKKPREADAGRRRAEHHFFQSCHLELIGIPVSSMV